MTTTKSTKSTKDSNALGPNAVKGIVATAIMDNAAKMLATWNPSRHQGITPEQALEAARQTFGYVSPAAWSYETAHPFFGVRNVGRPAPKQSAPKSAPKSAPAKSTAKSAPKSTAKSAPKRVSRASRSAAKTAQGSAQKTAHDAPSTAPSTAQSTAE